MVFYGLRPQLNAEMRRLHALRRKPNVTLVPVLRSARGNPNQRFILPMRLAEFPRQCGSETFAIVHAACSGPQVETSTWKSKPCWKGSKTAHKYSKVSLEVPQEPIARIGRHTCLRTETPLIISLNMISCPKHQRCNWIQSDIEGTSSSNPSYFVLGPE